VLVFWIGIQPKVFLDPMQPSLNPITATMEDAWRRQTAASRATQETDTVEELASRDR
jgi:hypothetical protein